MNRAGDVGESQDDSRDERVRSDAGNHGQVGKTSDGVEIKEHRGNRRGNAESPDDRTRRKSSDDLKVKHHRGNHREDVEFFDDRKDDRGYEIADIAGGRRGNQMKEEKAQLNHSSDPG